MHIENCIIESMIGTRPMTQCQRVERFFRIFNRPMLQYINIEIYTTILYPDMLYSKCNICVPEFAI